MSWRRVAAIYAVLALLAGVVVVLDRATPPPTPADAPAPTGPSILEADASAVTSITLRRESRVVRAVREDGRWRAIEPAGVQIPPDLFEATIATLTAGQSAERLGAEPEHDLAAYGLDVPSATLEIAVGPTTSVTVAIGGRNPTRTAVYARRSDQASIYLVGMNLSYYIDLVFDAAKT